MKKLIFSLALIASCFASKACFYVNINTTATIQVTQADINNVVIGDGTRTSLCNAIRRIYGGDAEYIPFNGLNYIICCGYVFQCDLSSTLIQASDFLDGITLFEQPYTATVTQVQ